MGKYLDMIDEKEKASESLSIDLCGFSCYTILILLAAFAGSVFVNRPSGLRAEER